MVSEYTCPTTANPVPLSGTGVFGYCMNTYLQTHEPETPAGAGAVFTRKRSSRKIVDYAKGGRGIIDGREDTQDTKDYRSLAETEQPVEREREINNCGISTRGHGTEIVHCDPFPAIIRAIFTDLSEGKL